MEQTDRLPMLGIDIPKRESHILHYDGPVGSFLEHGLSLYRSYGADAPERFYDDARRGHAFLFQFADNADKSKTHYHICCKAGLSREVEVGSLAHEETHLLDLTDKLSLLEDRIMETQGIKIGLKTIPDREVKAQIGKIFALTSQNIVLLDELRYADGTASEEARKIYQQAAYQDKPLFFFHS